MLGVHVWARRGRGHTDVDMDARMGTHLHGRRRKCTKMHANADERKLKCVSRENVGPIRNRAYARGKDGGSKTFKMYYTCTLYMNAWSVTNHSLLYFLHSNACRER